MKLGAVQHLMAAMVGIGVLFLIPAIVVWPTLIAGTKTPAVVTEVGQPSRQSKVLKVVTDSPGTVSRQYNVGVGRSDSYRVGDRVNVIASDADAYLDRGLDSWLGPLVPFLFYLMLAALCLVTWFQNRPRNPASRA
jgi:hypothetical protein